MHVGDLLRIGHKLWYRIGCGPGMPGPYRGGRKVRLAIVAGCAGGMYAAPTYKALQDPYRFPLDVTCGMVYTIGIRTVLFYYILYQLISDSVT